MPQFRGSATSSPKCLRAMQAVNGAIIIEQGGGRLVGTRGGMTSGQVSQFVLRILRTQCIAAWIGGCLMFDNGQWGMSGASKEFSQPYSGGDIPGT